MAQQTSYKYEKIVNQQDTALTAVLQQQRQHEVQPVENADLPQECIVAWTKHDENTDLCGCFSFPIVCFIYCSSFWPPLIFLLPCLCGYVAEEVSLLRNQYWILTETHLKIVIKGHDKFNIPGCYRTRNVTRSVIPLEHITECGVTSANDIYVKTVRSGSSYEVYGADILRSRAFVQKILRQRNVVRGMASPLISMERPDDSISTTAVVSPDEMEEMNAFQTENDIDDVAVAAAGNDENNDDENEHINMVVAKSPRDRLTEIKLLLEEGLITQEAYDDKCKDIIELI